MAPPAEKNKKHSSADHRPISSATIGGKQQQTLGSLMTSVGKRRSLRVAMKKNKRILRKIWICNDLWMDIFPHFDRPQLGLKMALLSPRFNSLVDKHFDGQSDLTIWNEIEISKIGTQAKLSVEESNAEFPLPDHPMHNKIRFSDLWINYIDHSVVTFLRSNQQIFDKGTNLDLYIEAKDAKPIWHVFAREIWPIFAQNIRHLSFSDADYLNNLLRLISPTILTELNQLNSIDSNVLLPDAIADDGPNATAGQAFLHANTSSASYIIRLEDFEPTENGSFELVNERTNEMLTLEKEENDDENMEKDDEDEEYATEDWLLKRCQIGKTIQWDDENLNNVSFMLCGTSCIGPLSSPKSGKKNAKTHLKMNAGPSGQRKKK